MREGIRETWLPHKKRLKYYTKAKSDEKFYLGLSFLANKEKYEAGTLGKLPCILKAYANEPHRIMMVNHLNVATSG